MNENPKTTSNMDYTRTDFRVKQIEFAIERAQIKAEAKVKIQEYMLDNLKRINAVDLETQRRLKAVDEREDALMNQYRNELAQQARQEEETDAGAF